MRLPADFRFSPSSLQDYVDCPRRFLLRHVQQVAWPALVAEPALENERRMRLGAAFHRLVRQYFLGIPPASLELTIGDPELTRWWHNFLTAPPPDLPPVRFSEVTFSTPLGGYRLLAQCDLVAVAPGERAVIVDWKTTRRRPRREALLAQVQSRAYPYLLVRSGAYLNNGDAFDPAQVEMVYWFAEFPAQPERLSYGDEQFAADESYLTGLVAEIAARDEEDFPLTTDERRCATCVYRSLCERGVGAAPVEDAEEGPEGALDFPFDFEQVTEVEY
jgi:hypothetical protein